MLYTAWYFSSEENYIQENAPYTKDGKRRGYRAAHPMTMWIGMALTLEYTYRYTLVRNI